MSLITFFEVFKDYNLFTRDNLLLAISVFAIAFVICFMWRLRKL